MTDPKMDMNGCAGCLWRCLIGGLVITFIVWATGGFR